MEDIDNIVNGIEQKLRNMETIEIKSKIIGEQVMRNLKKLIEIVFNYRI